MNAKSRDCYLLCVLGAAFAFVVASIAEAIDQGALSTAVVSFGSKVVRGGESWFLTRALSLPVLFIVVGAISGMRRSTSDSNTYVTPPWGRIVGAMGVLALLLLWYLTQLGSTRYLDLSG